MRKLLATFLFALLVWSGATQAGQDRLSVKEAFAGYTAEEVRNWVANFKLSDALTIGRAALWFGTNGSQVFPTATVPSRNKANAFKTTPMAAIPGMVAETSLGTMSLAEFIGHPKSYTRGFIVIHRGRIVYETYPGMLQTDLHVTASASKIFAALVIDVLIEEGVISEEQTIGAYVPGLEGSAWDRIKVIDIMDMATGLDAIDGPAYFADPSSIAARLLTAEMGDSAETMLDVMRDAKPVSKPGAAFTYSSTATQALVLLAEGASGRPWSELFDTRIWSKVRSDGAVQVHLSPDGIALAHGFMSIGLRDLARYGMLFTPSWKDVATKQVVTEAILNRTRSLGRTREFYRAGPSAAKFIERLGSPDIRAAGRQWDAIWDDGDFFKSGLNTQGVYVSPKRDLVIAYFSVDPEQKIQRFLRPLATSRMFDQEAR